MPLLQRGIAALNQNRGRDIDEPHAREGVRFVFRVGGARIYAQQRAETTGPEVSLRVKIKQGTSQQSQQALYKQMVTKAEPKPPRLRNAIAAFLTGGLVCLTGEGITDFWEATMGITHKQAGDPTVATLVFLGALLTGLGFFDKMARFAGAGLAVPVTGFANAMTASALEFKREGLVFGIGGRMFQLAGAVIVYGVTTAFFVGLLASLLKMFR